MSATDDEPRITDGQIDLTAAAAVVVAATLRASAVESDASSETVAADIFDALVQLHQMQTQLEAIEPVLIAAARRAGVSWQALAPALGVASRQAAERRYLRLAPATAGRAGDTRDNRVRVERDRRAAERAVAQWANDNTADLRRLAGQITALGDLDDEAAAPIDRLHHALADIDASALPALLADAQRHLHRHPQLADQVDAVTAQTEHVRRDTQRRRDRSAR